MEDQQAKFMPFHAINEFMRDDYRLEVVRTALLSLSKLPDVFQTSVERSTKKFVSIPGFRNSAKAPAALRIKPTADGFTKNPQLVAAILAAWAEANSDLRQKVYDLLIDRDWQLLPPDADRTKLPGFMIHWPKKEENFELLNNAFKEKNPGFQANPDDISLMVVWLSMSLPYDHESDTTPST